MRPVFVWLLYDIYVDMLHEDTKCCCSCNQVVRVWHYGHHTQECAAAQHRTPLYESAPITQHNS